MSVKMHSKLLEEVNKLADQFAQLTLSDEIKKPPDVIECSGEFKQDKTSTKVENSVPKIVNIHERTSDDEILSTNAVENKDVSTSHKSTCLKFSGDTLHPALKSDINVEVARMNVVANKDESSDDKTTCTKFNAGSSPENVKSDVSTHNKKVTVTKGVEIKDESTPNQSTCTTFYGETLPTVLKSGSNANDKEVAVTKSLENKDISTDDKMTCTKFNAESLPNEVKNDTSICNKSMAVTNAVKNKDESIIDKTTCRKFYAVALSIDAEHPKDPNSLVYSEFKLALSAVKSFKGSRFKEFSKKEDALQFASQSIEKVVAKAKAEDDGSTLRSATSQELCQLRKYIECGDEISFTNTIWKNPKMLVGTCDTPSIMQEGMRYNALHVAAKSNKPFLCQLILDTLENPKFLKQIYPSKSDIERDKIMYRLLDFYINTPDKKTGDTPLHYASKFGCLDCVKVLLAHPSCIPDRKNIAGFTARDIICNRLQPKSMSLIEGIEEVFKGLMYIPILRSEENDVMPVVGKPCSCKEIIESSRSSARNDSRSILSLKAFIGPMSPDIAEQFYLVIKKPSSSRVSFYTPEELKLISKIRFTDKDKGIERIGRWLSEDLNVPWQEYFPFLNTFSNLASEEGLRALESHLQRCKQDCHLPCVSDEPSEQSVFLVHQYPSHVNPLSHYINVQLELKKVPENYVNYDEIYCTPPSSPVKNPDEDNFVTPPASPPQNSGDLLDHTLFLQGASLSKLDVDAFLAVGETSVSEYPNVSRWKTLVENQLQTAGDIRSPHVNSLSLMTSVILPKLHLTEKICTPKKTLLNNAFCLENVS